MSDELRDFSEELNSNDSDIEQFDQPTDIKIGQIIAAPYEDDPSEIKYYRGKVVRITANDQGVRSFKVQHYHLVIEKLSSDL